MCDYDSNKQSTFIICLDKNNLYSQAMSEYLPYSEFEWLKNVDSFQFFLILLLMIYFQTIVKVEKISDIDKYLFIE